jgi:site-specific DNA-methyltransferase (adenine-specific)
MYIQGNINDIIKTLESDSIDLIYTDPPFAITKAKWDKPINWKELFPEMWRVLKPNGIIILYASMPFTYELLKYEKPKYHYTWIKNNSTGFFQAKKQPLRNIEEIFIYYKKNGTYNPQMIGNKMYPKRNVKYGGKQQYWGDGDRTNEIDKNSGHIGRFPTTSLNYPIRKDGTGITRTDEHIDYFIKTYSNENDKILDMTCHNKTVGNRCSELKRNYIGVDLNSIN